MLLHSRSPEETEQLARALAGAVDDAGAIVLLSGPLGAGKTRFVKGFAAGLGIPVERVQSPTFVIAQELPTPSGRLLVHVDCYRIASEGELESVGLFDWRPRLQFGTASRWVSLIATIFRVSILAALMVFVLLIARAPVARVGRAAAAAPFRAAVVGLAAEVLFLPLLLVASIALGITIIGLPLVFLVVPLAFVLAFFALMLGYTALACRLGEWLEDRLGWQLHSAYLATAIGLLLIVFPTLLSRLLGVAPEPLRMAAFGVLVAGVIAEFLVWTIGLGAALMTGLGRRNTFDAIDVHV